MTILKSVIELGLREPIRLLHVTDAHIELGEGEQAPKNPDHFEAAIHYARDNNLTVLQTGDISQGISDSTMRYVAQMLNKVDHISVLGNHDLCLCPDHIGLDDPAYQQAFLAAWSPFIRRDLYFASRIVQGINFVTLDNAYYQITSEQIQRLKAEVAKGYPVILCMHIPLFDRIKADWMLAKGRISAYMVAAPEAYLAKYGPKHRKQQAPTQETLESVSYIHHEPGIRAIIAGHTHENFDGFMECGKRLITTGPVRDGFIREISIV